MTELPPDGKRVYVANYASDTVSAINTASRTVVGNPIDVGDGPRGVAVAPDGQVGRYDWNFGDGQTALDAGPTPTHTYSGKASFPGARLEWLHRRRRASAWQGQKSHLRKGALRDPDRPDGNLDLADGASHQVPQRVLPAVRSLALVSEILNDPLAKPELRAALYEP